MPIDAATTGPAAHSALPAAKSPRSGQTGAGKALPTAEALHGHLAYRRYVEPVCAPSDPAALCRLGEKMLADGRPAKVFSAIPAGYTYFGQFIFHDFTWLDLASGQPRNRTTGALDLASVIGEGARFALDAGSPATTGLLAVGLTEGSGALPEDLPREANGCPMIADARNDDYLPLAQMHLLMIKFHNAVMRWHGAGGSGFDAARARRDFVLHIQHLVIEDYLRRICDPDVYGDVCRHGRAFIHPEPFVPGEAFEVPLEFAAAAARFGHSMIRDEYPAWNNTKTYPIPGELEAFIKFSHRNRRPNDGVMRALERQWVTNWRRLFDFSGHFAGSRTSQCLFAAPIGTRLMRGLGTLPSYVLRDGDARARPAPMFNLASQTLGRQHTFGLADAQTVIAAVNRHLAAEPIPVLTPDMLVQGENDEVVDTLSDSGFLKATPLWFYILKEAAALHAGAHLGPLGSRLVMETVHAAVEAAEPSVFKQARDWNPCFPRAQRDRFTMLDLIAFSTNPESGAVQRTGVAHLGVSSN